MSKPDFVYVTYIQAPAQRVWDALTRGEETIQFWSRYVQSEWEVGSRVEFLVAEGGKVSHDGEILEINAPTRLVMTFDTTPEGATERPSRVTYDLHEENGATRLTVTHDDFPPDSKVLPGISNGWPRILSSMKTLIESGAPMVMTEARRKASAA